MATRPESNSTTERPRLVLKSVSPSAVEYELTEHDGTARVVRVLVASGSTWLAACRFPNTSTVAGLTTGDDDLDDEIRTLASEDLIRLEAARRKW